MQLKEWIKNKDRVSVTWMGQMIFPDAEIVELIGNEGIVFRHKVDENSEVETYLDFRSAIRIDGPAISK